MPASVQQSGERHFMRVPAEHLFGPKADCRRPAFGSDQAACLR